MKDKENGNGSMALDEDSGHLDGNDVARALTSNLASCAQEEMLLSSAKSTLEITKSSNLLEVEVSFFQEEGRIALRANPLEWWQNMRMKYPFLARLARYVLSIPCNVKVQDNPVLCDGGLVKRGPSQMSMTDLCDLLAASMNLRTGENSHFEAASKQMWSTV
ncbi:Ribonuclease H-like domain [Phytophthora cactorum]|nr:Ribonuclease H-like domain [Phytophthora cactorum]